MATLSYRHQLCTYIALVTSESLAGLPDVLVMSAPHEVGHPLSRTFPALAPLLDLPQVAAGGDGDTPQQGGSWGPERFALTSLSVNRYIPRPR